MMKKILLSTLLFSAIYILTSFQSSEDEPEYVVTASNIAYVNNLLTDYISQLNQGSIKIMNEGECQKYKNNYFENLQNAGIYSYQKAGDTILKSDFNFDGQPDYFYAYNGINCTGKKDSSRYMSNFIIVSSSNQGLYINESLTDQVKQSLITGINSQIGNTGYKKLERARFMTGVRFDNIHGDTLEASFFLHTDKCNSDRPCSNGVLNYIFHTNRMSVRQLNIEYWY